VGNLSITVLFRRRGEGLWELNVGGCRGSKCLLMTTWIFVARRCACRFWLERVGVLASGVVAAKASHWFVGCAT